MILKKPFPFTAFAVRHSSYSVEFLCRNVKDSPTGRLSKCGFTALIENVPVPVLLLFNTFISFLMREGEEGVSTSKQNLILALLAFALIGPI